MVSEDSRYMRYSVILLFLSVAIAVSMKLGGFHSLDQAGVTLLRIMPEGRESIAPEWLTFLMTVITHIGSSAVLAVFSLLAIIFFAVKVSRESAVKLLIGFGSAFVLAPVLKAVFARARPDLVTHYVEATSASFPSGHTLRSTIVYFLLAFLFLRGQSDNDRGRVFFALVMLLIVLIGISRVYLGVHWPSDVLFGWSVGLCWSFFWLGKIAPEEVR